MQMHAETWGHVALATPATAAMEIAEDKNEIAMLRCRFAIKPIPGVSPALGKMLPTTRWMIHNPGTLSALAEIYNMSIDQTLFALAIH